MNKHCTHENIEHQRADYDTNVDSVYTCMDCGKDLEPPETDWDLLVKEQKL